MKLSLSEDSEAIGAMFDRFFTENSTSAQVRAAEPLGFDAELWKDLIQIEAPSLRLAQSLGGGGMSLFDACLMMEQAGRRLAPVPLAEVITALQILRAVDSEDAIQWIERVRAGDAIVTVAPRIQVAGRDQIVPAGAIATAILTFTNGEIAIEVPKAPLTAPQTLGCAAAALLRAGETDRRVLSSGSAAEQIWSSALEEWKILTSAALIGLAREAISMAADYAKERIAFEKPIGAYQAIAHPLATDIIDADGGLLLLWWTLRAVADGRADASACISMLWWWACQTATNSVAHALHTFGGYGLTNEYDIQLYHRRAKSWALILGDPQDELVHAGRRLLDGGPVSLPDPGDVEINFDPPSGGEALAAETRALFERILDPAKHRLGEHTFDAHDWGVHRALGSERLLFPHWPAKFGGRDEGEDASRASRAVWAEVGYAGLAQGGTGMIGQSIMQFGSPELQDEVLSRFASGEMTAVLGYTEPSGGSDVFAARTRAIRDGDDWIVNGQKMFTSGAEHASFVFLIARTNPEAPKHKGITLFLVPLDAPGVEIHPIHTMMDERTNATFYTDVRIPDRYRIGDVDGGTKVLSAALSLEQGGISYERQLEKMAEAAADWARQETRDGRPVIASDAVLARIARVHVHARINRVLSARVLGMKLAGLPDLAYGPACKVFATNTFIADAADLMDLTAPWSLLRGPEGPGLIEQGYRHSTATSIYGGTTEVLLSMVAERRLGLPRSRS